MFEPTFYTCHKLLNPSLSLEQLEAHGDTHVLSWLGEHIRAANLLLRRCRTGVAALQKGVTRNTY